MSAARPVLRLLLALGGGVPLAADAPPSVALAPPSAPAGATLFTRLPAADTGLHTENPYADPRMWGDLFAEFQAGALGTGLAIADYDGDGRPDVFVVSKTGSCRLFRNLGGWKFEDVTGRAGVGDRGDAALVWKQGAAFADINNDGRPDLYVCRFRAPNLLYINQGDGTFREEAAARGLALADASSMAAFCDYDRDGWLDVHVLTNLLDAAARPDGQPDRLYRNNRDGTFTDVTTAAGLTGDSQGHSATWWDFDDDGWPDLHVANDFAVPDRLWRNNGDGTFTDVAPAVLPHLPYSAMGADLGDLDNDGRVDLLVADMAATTPEKDQRGMADSRALGEHQPAPGPRQIHRNVLYLNTGARPLPEVAPLAGLAATDWTWSVRLEDFDNDGRVDAFFTNGMFRELHNLDLLRRMMRAESARERIAQLRHSPVLAETNLAFRNLGDLQFEPAGPDWGLDHTGVSFGAATGDLDGDGDLDLVISNYQDGITVYRNDSPGGARLIVALRGTVSNRFGVGATVRIETDAGLQVRPLVLARGYASTSEPVLHFGLGADEVVRRLVVLWPGGGEQVYTHLPAGRRYTITEPPGPAALPPPAPLPPVAPAVPAPEPGPEVATEADWDRDGDPDRFTAGPDHPGGVLWRNDGGLLAEATAGLAPDLRTAGPVTAALWSDADGDGWPDLLVAEDWGGVRLFRNEQGRGFSERTQEAGFAAAGTGWWRALASADFNGDGRPDFAAGNAGLNLVPCPAPGQAVAAVRGDFNGTGRPEEVRAFQHEGRWYPQPSRRELGALVPAVLRRFPGNDAYARATLGELLGTDALAAAEWRVATEASSGVFLSQPDGTWRFVPLPRRAQMSPVRTLAAGDFDGNGHADLRLLPAAAGTDPARGDLWLGDGRGGFSAAPR